MRRVVREISQISGKKYYNNVQSALKTSKRAEKLMTALRPLAGEYGMSKLSRDSGVDRAHLYTLLSAKGDPRLTTLTAILDTLGFKLDVNIKKK